MLLSNSIKFLKTFEDFTNVMIFSWLKKYVNMINMINMNKIWLVKMFSWCCDFIPIFIYLVSAFQSLSINGLKISFPWLWNTQYSDVMMSAMASQITGVSNVCLTLHSNKTSKLRWSVDSPHKGSVTWKIFPFDDVFMYDLAIWLAITHRVKETYTPQGRN